MGNVNYFSIDDFFDGLFKDINHVLESEVRTVYSSNFPPVNLILKKNKDLVFEFAVAGYKEDEIDLSFEGDKMFLELKKIPKDEEEGDTHLIRGIKLSGQKSWYFVPVSKYDASKAEAKMKDGILEVTIPSKEEAKPKKVKINL